MVDCSSSMASTDFCYSSLRAGYKVVIAENIDEISINSLSGVESYCINSCERFDICDGIINNKSGNDAVSIITFSNGIKSNSGFSYNKSYLRNALGNNLKNIGGGVYNAINASDLTYQSGGIITSPEQFVGTDSDGDGIPDLVELYGLKPNGEPMIANPYSRDTDGDGIDDNVELGYIPGVLTSSATIA